MRSMAVCFTACWWTLHHEKCAYIIPVHLKVKNFGTCRPAIVHPPHSSDLAQKTLEWFLHIMPINGKQVSVPQRV